MKTYLYLLILTIAVVFAGISYFVNNRFVDKTASQKVMRTFLLFFMVHCGYILITRFIWEENLFVNLGAPFMAFYGPFFYCNLEALKVRSISDFQCGRKALHFTVAFLFSLVYIIALFAKGELSVEFLVYYYFTLYIISAVSLVIYGIYGYIVISKIGVISNHFRFVFLRIIWLMLFLAIILIGSVVFEAIPDEDVNILYLGMLLLSVAIFHFYSSSVKYHSSRKVTEDELQVLDADLFDDEGKYEKSKLSSELLKEYKLKIDKVIIMDQLFLDPDFSTDVLEAKARIPKHHIAQVFSLIYKMNFKAYVNSLRIHYVLDKINDNQNTTNISELGEECGFNSRTSFFRAFKKVTGVSPSEYLDQHKQQL